MVQEEMVREMVAIKKMMAAIERFELFISVEIRFKGAADNFQVVLDTIKVFFIIHIQAFTLWGDKVVRAVALIREVHELILYNDWLEVNIAVVR
jgi:hypothetical protein